MTAKIIQKSLNLLLKRQTNILSAAFVIMATVVLSHILGLVKSRLLATIFGVSSVLGIYDYSSLLPETLFQLTIAAALSSAFIPVFTDYLTKGEEKEAHRMASTLLSLGLVIFAFFSIILAIFAPFFLSIFNLGSQFSPDQITLMANLMRVLILGQLFFIIGTFFSALLQSYNHFFIPGFALALYNLGIIIGIVILSPFVGIYSAPIGVVIGGIIYVAVQIPMARKTGFSFVPTFEYIHSYGVQKIGRMMWPRTLSLIVFQFGTLSIGACISFLADPGRMNVIYNFAKTLAFAPVTLFGQPIAQAAFPVLARERNNPEVFKQTFQDSFNQMLYIILPISVLILVLRIPIVRLVYGAERVDWAATVMIGRTLAFFSISIFAQALTALALRAFYALHNTKIPLVVGVISTIVMLGAAFIFVSQLHLGVEWLAIAYSIGNIFQLLVLLLLLDRKLGGFNKLKQLTSLAKFLICTILTGCALYIPIKLLDQLVFDTTRTVNLVMLTGISSSIGLLIYLLLSWLLKIEEASIYLAMLKRVASFHENFYKGPETVEGPKI
jgi:putative peptidoglycan lipid II flippase